MAADPNPPPHARDVARPPDDVEELLKRIPGAPKNVPELPHPRALLVGRRPPPTPPPRRRRGAAETYPGRPEDRPRTPRPAGLAGGAAPSTHRRARPTRQRQVVAGQRDAGPRAPRGGRGRRHHRRARVGRPRGGRPT